jgi:hypothetical protein
MPHHSLFAYGRNENYRNPSPERPRLTAMERGPKRGFDILEAGAMAQVATPAKRAWGSSATRTTYDPEGASPVPP